MILLIYREEVYNKETPKQGVAEIDLAKHRNGEIGRLRLTFRGQFSRFENYVGSGIRRRNHALIRLIRALIDTAALRHNLGTIRAYAPRAKVMAVIKANAYGHGLVSTALALADADSFGVRRLEEGMALRAAGVRAPIVLLEGVFSAEQLVEAAHHRFELRGSRSPGRSNYSRRIATLRRFIIWMQIDTGMNRLGFRPEKFTDALASPAVTVPALELRVMHTPGARP